MIRDQHEQDSWIALGVLRGWCSLPVCSTHDGVPLSALEEAEVEDGFDPCAHVLRLWTDDHRSGEA